MCKNFKLKSWGNFNGCISLLRLSQLGIQHYSFLKIFRGGSRTWTLDTTGRCHAYLANPALRAITSRVGINVQPKNVPVGSERDKSFGIKKSSIIGLWTRFASLAFQQPPLYFFGLPSAPPKEEKLLAFITVVQLQLIAQHSK